MWLQVVHEANLANSVHGVRVQPEAFTQYFDVELPVNPSTRKEIMLDCVRTAVALSARVIRESNRIVWPLRSILTPKGAK